jgi:sugar diacid utilization regulator
MSNLYSQLEDFIQSIIQAEQAMNTPRNNALVSYSDLGLLGEILQNLDRDQLIKVAQNELKELLNGDPKSKELLYTLFTYLKNSGKLEKTTLDLSLSLGGVQYRMRRIEDILKKDLKDAANTSYLFLLLESLIIIGEIDF